MGDRPNLDVASMVVVPARPGPIVRLDSGEPGRDDVDDLLDDLFGAPDDRGPGIVDGVLLVGGVCAVVGAAIASLPTAVTVCGVLAAGLGAVLPVRSLWRRVRSSRRTSRLASIIGDGTLLRTDSVEAGRLVEAYSSLLAASERLADEPRRRVRDVGHAALAEVASLLGGRGPAGRSELDYVASRARALDELRSVVADPRVGDGEGGRRDALVEARGEVDEIAGGSSLTQAADLANDLLGRSGS